ncbi:MAG: carbohydrate deacetylase [Anaerorhabdus sp.]
MELIVNADDFGLTKGVVDGIIFGYENGIIRSTTALCNSKYLEYGAQKAKEYDGLAIGVHLVLTLGKSITENSTLTDGNGNFYSRTELDAKQLDEVELYNEWKAQILRYITVFGKNPSHLDSHHSVHDMCEVSKNVSTKLAKEFGLEFRRNGKYTFINNFYGESATVDNFINILKENKGCKIEVMCHPAFNDTELMEISSYNANREKELAVLCDEKVKQYIAENCISVINYQNGKGVK